MAQTDRTTGLVGNTGVKQPVKAATTANITLSGEQTIDGIACVTGDRVLVKDQTDSVENGIYEVDTSSWERTDDFDGPFDIVKGSLVWVNSGDLNGDSFWRVSSSDPITIDTSNITFAKTGTLGDTVVVERHIATAGQTAITLNNAYTPGVNAITVHIDGLLVVGGGVDYTETDANTITIAYALSAGMEVVVAIQRMTSPGGTIDSANVSHTAAGTGAVATNVKAVLDREVFVTSFGADNTGSSECMQEIQNALTAGAGGCVRFPAGSYKIDGTVILSGNTKRGLEIPSNTTVIFDQGAILFQDPTKDTDYIIVNAYNVDNVVIRGGLIRGCVTAAIVPETTFGYGIYIWGSTDVSVHDTIVEDQLHDGVTIGYADETAPYSDSENIHLHNVTCRNCKRDPVLVFGCLGGGIHGGSFSGAGGNYGIGIDLEPQDNAQSLTTSVVRDFVIEGAHVFDNELDGIQIYGGGADAVCTRVTVTGCNVHDNGTAATVADITVRNASYTTVVGNNLFNSPLGVQVHESSHDVVIADNTIRGQSTTSTGIRLLGEAAETVRCVVVANNTIEDGATGIHVYSNASTVSDVTVTGNHVYSTDDDGIILGGSSIVCTSNVVANSGNNGILVANSSGNVLIQSNIVYTSSQDTDNTYDNIQVGGSTQVQVLDNVVVHGGGAKQPKYGINIKADCTDCIADRNDVVNGGKTADLINLSTRTAGFVAMATRAATYEWTGWSPSDVAGTLTNAPATGTATDADNLVTGANASGTVTFTCKQAGRYKVTLASAGSHAEAYTFARYTFVSGGTATRHNNSLDTITVNGIAAEDTNHFAENSYLVTADAGETITILPKQEINATVTTNHTAYARAIVEYLGG